MRLYVCVHVIVREWMSGFVLNFHLYISLAVI
jgi:hypothetical protein